MITVPGLIIVIVESHYPFLIDWFKASAATPWGIVASIWIHGNLLSHFASNAAFLLLLCLYFALTNERFLEETRRSRSRFLTGATFLGAVFANVLFIALAPLASSYGASGTVYASLGVVFGFALDNIIPRAEKSREILTFYRNRSNLGTVITNALIFLLFFTVILTNPNLFLAKGGNANVFSHRIAFFGAFGATLTLTFRDRRRIALDPQATRGIETNLRHENRVQVAFAIPPSGASEAARSAR